MTTLRSAIAPMLMMSALASLDAAPGQLPDFRMAAQIAHFDITCPPEFDAAATVIGRRAEIAYQRVSSMLRHDLSFRPLLVLFATRADQMRAIESRTVPGNREHVLLTLDTPDARLDGQLVHDLSHVFLFDALAPGRHRDVPLWVLEGLAEHQRGEWDADDLSILKRLVGSGTMPTLSAIELGQVETRNGAVFGHAAFDFLSSRAGSEGLRRFFQTVRENPAGNLANAYIAAVGLSRSDFDEAFAAYLTARP